MEYVTHDEIVELINILMPFFAFFFAMSVVVLYHMTKTLIDNIFWFFEHIKGVEDKHNGQS